MAGYSPKSHQKTDGALQTDTQSPMKTHNANKEVSVNSAQDDGYWRHRNRMD